MQNYMLLYRVVTEMYNIFNTLHIYYTWALHD